MEFGHWGSVMVLTWIERHHTRLTANQVSFFQKWLKCYGLAVLKESFLLPIVSSGMLYLVSAIEIIAALLIGLASLQCAVTVTGLFYQRSPSTAEKEDVRLQFGL